MITNSVKNKDTLNILKGINILLKYNPNYSFEHLDHLDVIAFGESELKVSEEDEKELVNLGWFVEDYYSWRWAYWI